MQRIDPSALSRAELIAARDESARQADICDCAAVLAKGARKRQLRQWARAHWQNAMAADSALSGASAAADMSADELLSALLA